MLKLILSLIVSFSTASVSAEALGNIFFSGYANGGMMVIKGDAAKAIFTFLYPKGPITGQDLSLKTGSNIECFGFDAAKISDPGTYECYVDMTADGKFTRDTATLMKDLPPDEEGDLTKMDIGQGGISFIGYDNVSTLVISGDAAKAMYTFMAPKGLAPAYLNSKRANGVKCFGETSATDANVGTYDCHLDMTASGLFTDDLRLLYPQLR